MFKCSVCGKKCFENKYPEIVFQDEHKIVCEECSIDYEEDEDGIHIRKDLMNALYKDMNFWDWCALDRNDERKINYEITYTKGSEEKTEQFTSEDKVDGLMMIRIQNSFINDLKLANNEWYVKLIA